MRAARPGEPSRRRSPAAPSTIGSRSYESGCSCSEPAPTYAATSSSPGQAETTGTSSGPGPISWRTQCSCRAASSVEMCGPPKDQPLPSVRSKREPEFVRLLGGETKVGQKGIGTKLRRGRAQRIDVCDLDSAESSVGHRGELALQLGSGYRRAEPPPAHQR